MRIVRSVTLCALLAGSMLFLTAGASGAASSPASGPPGTVITVTVPSCPSPGTPRANLVDVVVLDSQSGVVGSGTVSVTVPFDVPTGHTLTVFSGCDNLDNPQTTFLVTAGNSATVATPGGTVTISAPADDVVTDVASTGVPAGAPSGVSFPYGLVGFSVHGAGTGFTIQVVLTFPAPVSEYWKYQGGAWSKFAGATFAGNTAALTLTDGGAGDADGIANGTIVDPGAAGVPVSPGAPTALLLSPSLTG